MTSDRKRRGIVVAMSGGVDSSVAALLLKERGHEVTGLFMRTGAHSRAPSRGCCSAEDGRDAARVADLLGIPFYALDFEEEFASIVDYFTGEYAAGRTPNPCVVCNRDLKFGRLFEYAGAVGADAVATGHYASVVRHGERRAIRRGRDRGKDQSYVLFPLGQDRLRRTVLPLGGLQKGRVREIAREAGLPVSSKEESQEVCFVPDEGLGSFLREKGLASPGPMMDEGGEVVGRHEGVAFFTVGQRRGLGRSFGEPRFVTGLDAAARIVRIGPKEALMRGGLVAGDWVGGSRSTPTEGEAYRAEVMIRYRHRGAGALVRGLGSGRVAVEFDETQAAVTPGQAVVAYEGDLVAGGGWIEAAR